MPVVLAATITLFLLAVIRMVGLVRQQQQSVDRETCAPRGGCVPRDGDQP